MGGAAVPDVSRGYDVAEYAGMWKALQKETWPSVQKFSVVGPMGNDFKDAAEACVVKALGWDAIKVHVEPRKRWQAVRLEVRCTSPDDFCHLHSTLKNLDGVRFML